MKLLKTLTVLAAWMLSACTAFTADAPRTITLEAKDAKIAGGARYDDTPEYRCFRYWSTTSVVARWTFDVPAKGAYRILLTYACPADLAGSEIEVNVAGQRAAGLTQTSGGWMKFKEFDLGPILLRKPGAVELSVKATRSARGSVWDLRTVKLVKDD